MDLTLFSTLKILITELIDRTTLRSQTGDWVMYSYVQYRPD